MSQPDPSVAMATAQVKAIVDNADRLGITWTLRPGTVASSSPLTVTMDGDTVPISMFSMIGATYAGQRVWILIVPPSGNYVIGDALGTQLGARARVTNAQSINNNTDTPLIWNQIDENSGATFIATNGTTFTIPADGLWSITAVLVVAAGGGARNFVAINATSTLTGAPGVYRATFDNAAEVTTVAAATVPMLAGDTFTVSAFQSSGVARTVSAWVGVYRTGGFAQ